MIELWAITLILLGCGLVIVSLIFLALRVAFDIFEAWGVYALGAGACLVCTGLLLFIGLKIVEVWSAL